MIKNWTVASLLALFIAGCTANVSTEQKETNIQELPVMQLQTYDTLIPKNYVADIQAIKNVEIRARVQGYIETILVDEGQEVKKGQPLFRLNATEYEAGLEKARAVLANAQAEAQTARLEVKRVKLLVDKKIIAATELELAESKVQSAMAHIAEAKSAVNHAQALVSYTFIRSPFDGVIDRIPLKIGSLVNDGTLLTTISDLHSMSAYFHVSESEYLHRFKAKLSKTLKQMDDLQLVLADGSVYPYKGQIETVETEFDAGTGSIAFRAKFDNPDKLLKHGASGTIRMETEVEDVLLVPQKSVMEIQDKNYVFVVDANNMVKMRSFIPKARVAASYLIESGLKAGERIVYEGVQNLREGMVIKPLKKS